MSKPSPNLPDLPAQGSQKSGSDRRTLRGLLVKPRAQMRYSFLLMGGGMWLLTIFIAGMIYELHDSVAQVQKAYGLSDSATHEITSWLTSSLAIGLLLSLVLSVFAFVVGIQISHKFYGPLVPIQDHITNLKDGMYGSRINLRQGDELVELQDALNDLAMVLETKYPDTPIQITNQKTTS